MYVDCSNNLADSVRMTGNTEIGGALSGSLAKIRLDLGGVGGNGADVCNVVAFFEGRDCVDVQDDTGERSSGFEYDFAEIVRDKADFHALLDIGTTLHKRVPNARAVGQDIHDSVEPDGILDGPRVS